MQGLNARLRGILSGSVVKFKIDDRKLPGWSLPGSIGLFLGVSWGRRLQNPRLVLVKPWKEINDDDVGCCSDKTEIMLKRHKTALNQSI